MPNTVFKPTADTDASTKNSPSWPKHSKDFFEEISPGADAVANPAAKLALKETERALFQRKALDY